ncbi:MAG: WYL domain-containing protein, partial [Clostridia bacterium]|nr:WYL domain-containing protein [Clostridia bacterium]
MSAYNELIKSFERIRAYVRDFYIYGFRSREEFRQKSARSYDDERRRVESWLGEYMRFIRSAEGKSVFLSIDSRITEHNPLYKAWKAKSFTDGDITLHFILLDILFRPEEEYSLSELMKKMEEEYFSCFPSPMTFDESTVRKKLKEYLSLGIVTAKKSGRSTIYSRAADDLRLPSAEALHFFSEAAPCGVVGS